MSTSLPAFTASTSTTSINQTVSLLSTPQRDAPVGCGLRSKCNDGAFHSWKSSKRITPFLLLAMSLALATLLGFLSGGSQQRHHSGSYLRNNLPPSSSLSSSRLELQRFLQEVSGDTTTTNGTMVSLFVDGCTLEYCTANYQSQICPEENDWISAVPVAIQVILTIVLLLMSALFSGLTLGLMSLDITGLEIVMAGDDPLQAKYAKEIYPVRKKGNLLLCTLLLGNVAVNSLLSILMAAFTGGTVGFITSTLMIVILGEILPQALVRLLQLEMVWDVCALMGFMEYSLSSFNLLFHPVFSLRAADWICRSSSCKRHSHPILPACLAFGQVFGLDAWKRTSLDLQQRRNDGTAENSR